MLKEVKKPCPICGKDFAPPFAPFCSQRCVTIDLGRWLGESYIAQTDEEPDQDDQ